MFWRYSTTRNYYIKDALQKGFRFYGAILLRFYSILISKMCIMAFQIERKGFRDCNQLSKCDLLFTGWHCLEKRLKFMRSVLNLLRRWNVRTHAQARPWSGAQNMANLESARADSSVRYIRRQEVATDRQTCTCQQFVEIAISTQEYHCLRQHSRRYQNKFHFHIQ